jgi:hypothetical protein
VSEPEPPQLVCLRYADGSTSDPLPLLYRGLDDDACDLWEALAPDEREPSAILVGRLPGSCTIRVSLPRS